MCWWQSDMSESTATDTRDCVIICEGILITLSRSLWFRNLLQLFPIVSYSSSKSIPMAGAKCTFENFYVWTRLSKFINKWYYPFIVNSPITPKVYLMNKASKATVLHTFYEFFPLQTSIKGEFTIKDKTCVLSPVLTDKLAFR